MKHVKISVSLIRTNKPNDPSVLDRVRELEGATLHQGDEITDVRFASDSEINIFWASILASDRETLYKKLGCVWLNSFRAPGYCNTLRLSDGHEWSACIKRNDYPAVVIVKKTEERVNHG